MKFLLASLSLLCAAACGDVDPPAIASDEHATITQEKRQHAEGEHDCCDNPDHVHDHDEAECGHHHGHDHD